MHNCRDPYLFREPDFADMTDAQLHGVIALNLKQALCMPDGSDFHSDVRRDLAQDRIAQARDILVSRGHIFTESLK